ncbi:MAG TPA: IPT/TIG domain-containing protein, partial [Gemmataceae bacterium]|nr:IPT/TIG domain-containing protein [Gemmataceae bacterium]
MVWDKDGVDQLLANNFDGLWALPFGASPAARRALTGTSEAGNSRPVQAEAGTNGSVGAPSGSAGAEAPPPPSSAESAAPTAKIPYGWIAGPQQPVTQPGLTGSGGVGPFGFVSNDPIDETPLPDTPGDVFATNTPGDSLGTGDIYSGNPPGDFSLPSGPGDIFSTNTPGYSPPSGGPGDIFSGNGSGTPPPSTGPGDIFSSNSPPNNPAPPVGTGDVFSSNSSDKNCTNTSPAVQPNANNGQAGSAVSGNPVREFDGMPVISATDLSSSALGFPWGQTRSWTGLNNSSFNGNGWAVSELPYLVVGGGINGGPDVAPGTTPDNRISVIQGGDSTYTFTIPSSGPYTSYPAWGAQNNRLDWVPGSVPILRLTDSQGNVTEFYDVNRNATNQPIAHSMGTDLSHKYGRFKSYTAANGISQVTADYDAAGYLTAVTLTDSATGATDQFAYTYATVTNDLVAAANASPPQLVTQVTLQRSDGQGGWQPVQRAEYSYYTGRLPNGAGGWQNDPNGRLGDLQMVQIENPVATGDGSITWQRIDAHYYRYYKLTGEGFLPSQGPTNNALTTGGPDPIEPSGGKYNSNSPGAGGDLHLFSGLKTVVGGAALDRLADAVPNYLTASDAAIQPYVNNFFTYERWADHVGSDGDPSFGANYWENTDTNYYWRTGYRVGTRYRVTEEIAQGAGCSTCSGGQGTSKFEYAGNYDLVGLGFNTIDYNLWRMKTTEYLPGDSPNWGDHDREVVYTDEVGQPVLEDYVHVGGASMAVTSMTVTASSASGGTITVVAPNHGLNTGDVVAISGVLPELYNGVFTVTRVDANTFRFTLPFHYYGPNVDNPDVPQPYINQTVAATSVHTTITKVLGQWETSYRYDDQGRLILKAMPSSVSGFDDSQSDLLSKDTPGHYQNLYDHQGLIELADYYDSTTATETTPGGVAGYLKDTKIEQGQLGTPVLQRSQQYYAHSVVNPTVDVRVTTPQGTSAATPVDQFTYTAPVVAATPVVTGLGPASGVREGGYNVTLIGSHFTGAFAVLFGGVATSSFAVRSDNVINVYSIPAHAAGVVDVTVVTPSGTSITSAGDEFTYVARPAPVVTGVGAATGFTPGGENVILVGSSFTGATAVSFGGVAPSFFHVDSDSQITVTGVPAHTAGVVDVTVTTPSGTSAISAADQYTYLTRPAPVVAGLGPPAGLTQGGYTTTIVGSSFTGATAVSFGGTVVSFFHVDSDTQISVFNTPAHSAGVVDVTVTTPSGTSALSAADQFTYLASSPAPGAPTITGLSPATGLNLGGYRVTVVGSNFSKATAVSFGGKSVSFSVDSDSRISIFDAPAHAAGVVDITVTTPSGTSATSAADQFTYLAPVPAITALGPATGLNLGGYTVSMVGSHFSGATTVSFGGKSVPFTVNSDNQITVFGLPAHAAGVVDVTVTTPSGTSALSAADQFIYIAPLPTVSALAPASGLNLGGYSVTLVGNHFSGATNVSFGGKSVSFSVDSDNQITVFSLPAHAAGMVDVTVTTPSGTSDLSPADQFTFLGPVPTVSGLGPPFGLNGGGDSLSVVGSHFTGATAISFGGSTVNNFQVVSDSLITVFRTPAHAAGVVDVRVTTPSGTSAISAPDQFTYGPSRPPPGPPVVGGLTPTAGS